MSRRMELKFERVVAAPPAKVFTAWLDPKVKGTCWHASDELVFNPKAGQFFYMLHDVWPHYGRFIKVEKPARVQLTWMSPNTSGQESVVTVRFKKKGAGTQMTLVHSNLPNDAGGRAHNDGWNYYLDLFAEQFGKGR